MEQRARMSRKPHPASHKPPPLGHSSFPSSESPTRRGVLLANRAKGPAVDVEEYLAEAERRSKPPANLLMVPQLDALANELAPRSSPPLSAPQQHHTRQGTHPYGPAWEEDEDKGIRTREYSYSYSSSSSSIRETMEVPEGPSPHGSCHYYDLHPTAMRYGSHPHPNRDSEEWEGGRRRREAAYPEAARGTPPNAPSRCRRHRGHPASPSYSFYPHTSRMRREETPEEDECEEEEGWEETYACEKNAHRSTHRHAGKGGKEKGRYNGRTGGALQGEGREEEARWNQRRGKSESHSIHEDSWEHQGGAPCERRRRRQEGFAAVPRKDGGRRERGEEGEKRRRRRTSSGVADTPGVGCCSSSSYLSPLTSPFLVKEKVRSSSPPPTEPLPLLISSTERVRYRNEVTKKLLDWVRQVSDMYDCQETMEKEVWNSMCVDPRYTAEKKGSGPSTARQGTGIVVTIAQRPQREQRVALRAVLASLEVLQGACVELVSAYLTPEEKRYLGLNTHFFQTQKERRTRYQYDGASMKKWKKEKEKTNRPHRESPTRERERGEGKQQEDHEEKRPGRGSPKAHGQRGKTPEEEKDGNMFRGPREARDASRKRRKRKEEDLLTSLPSPMPTKNGEGRMEHKRGHLHSSPSPKTPATTTAAANGKGTPRTRLDGVKKKDDKNQKRTPHEKEQNNREPKPKEHSSLPTKDGKHVPVEKEEGVPQGNSFDMGKEKAAVKTDMTTISFLASPLPEVKCSPAEVTSPSPPGEEKIDKGGQSTDSNEANASHPPPSPTADSGLPRAPVEEEERYPPAHIITPFGASSKTFSPFFPTTPSRSPVVVTNPHSPASLSSPSLHDHAPTSSQVQATQASRRATPASPPSPSLSSEHRSSAGEGEDPPTRVPSSQIPSLRPFVPLPSYKDPVPRSSLSQSSISIPSGQESGKKIPLSTPPPGKLLTKKMMVVPGGGIPGRTPLPPSSGRSSTAVHIPTVKESLTIVHVPMPPGNVTRSSLTSEAAPVDTAMMESSARRETRNNSPGEGTPVTSFPTPPLPRRGTTPSVLRPSGFRMQGGGVPQPLNSVQAMGKKLTASLVKPMADKKEAALDNPNAVRPSPSSPTAVAKQPPRTAIHKFKEFMVSDSDD